jgi:hypothetical protein
MIVTLKSQNEKLGPMAATYRGLSDEGKKSTCSPDCPLKNKGCYAEFGPMAWGTKKAELNPKDDWKQVADFVDSLPHGASVRFHVKGDFYYNGKLDKEYISALRLALYKRQDLKAWTYTHARGEDLRYLLEMFSDTPLCVNVSLENLQPAVNYCETGVPTVVTVGEDFHSQKFNNVLVRVCSALLDDKVTCSQCKLCAHRPRNFVVAFRAHGSLRKQIHTQL